MSATKASTSYKKEDGTLAWNKAKSVLTWTPVKPRGSPAQLIIAISDVASRYFPFSQSVLN